jgi:hypothetical protein
MRERVGSPPGGFLRKRAATERTRVSVFDEASAEPAGAGEENTKPVFLATC